MDSARIPVFDGHNDVLSHMRQHGPGAEEWFFKGSDDGQFDLPRAAAGSFAGGIFSLHVPEPSTTRGRGGKRQLGAGRWEIPYAPPLDGAYARAETLALFSELLRLERMEANRIQVVRDAVELRTVFASERVAVVMHIEGADAIDPDLHVLDVLYAAGLRSLGIVWSRPNLFGCGVPFRFPSSPDIGGGLSDLGVELVQACNDLGIVVDTAHLNLRGFFDVAEYSTAPLVASHACAHAIAASSRNLTDEQLDAIAASRGVIGLSFDAADLRPDGQSVADTPMEAIVRQVDYLVSRMGIEHVGLGSDFDGTLIPADVGDVAGLPKVIAALRAQGYGEEDLRRLAHENWLRVLEATWSGRSAP
jgi:membrane dipeptidase